MLIQAHSRNYTPQLTLTNTHCEDNRTAHKHTQITRSVQINLKNLQDGLT